MSLLHVSLFGRFSVQNERGVLAGFEAARVQELFCYLLLFRGPPHPREALATILWDECDTNRPGRCLRKAVWQLKSALDTAGDHLSDHVLTIEPEWLQVNPEADVWIDAAVFEQAFDHTREVRGKELDPDSVEMLKRVVDLYRGGLQQSWYQDWYMYERERFEQMYLIMLGKLVGYCEAQQAYEAGVAYCNLILRREPAHERTHRRLMRLHNQAGDRTAALRQYARCAGILDEELGVEPAGLTTALYEEIRADHIARPAAAPGDYLHRSGAERFPPPEMLDHLEQLRAALLQVQSYTRHGLQAVERALHDRH